MYNYFSVEVVFDDQCDVIWTLPEGVDMIPLFQTTSFNIDGECLDLIGGVQGRTFHFQVREREREREREPALSCTVNADFSYANYTSQLLAS